jgi:hypothetical protein
LFLLTLLRGLLRRVLSMKRDSMGTAKPAGETGRQDTAPTPIVDPAADLTGLSAAEFDAMDSEERVALLTNIDARYKIYLKNFYELSNTCVTRYDRAMSQHRTWRYVAIIGTGMLAALNFIAAHQSVVATTSKTVSVSSTAAIVASVGALLLAVLANLETFSNSAERAHTYRDSRELYLDAAEEYERAWSVTVVALGDSARAYANATELYRRVVAADRELRRSFKDLAKK